MEKILWDSKERRSRTYLRLFFAYLHIYSTYHIILTVRDKDRCKVRGRVNV